MANIDKYELGSFCWIELGTTDQAAAKSFYGSLFGWSPQDLPMGPNDFYTMFQLQGREAAAGYTLRPDQSAHGVPPHWMIYVAVENADAAAARVKELGGAVLRDAFDVFDAGRMAVLQDPTGAAFCAWQSKERAPNGIGGVEGTLCWADLSTPDRDRVESFYTGLFGWKIGKEDEDPAHAYWHIQNGEEFIGGIPPAAHRNPQMPAHWLAYFQVNDCYASATKAKELGAQFHVPPMVMEDVGTIAILADPQGATFAIFQPPADQKSQ
jgi:uncharacterized protein